MHCNQITSHCPVNCTFHSNVEEKTTKKKKQNMWGAVKGIVCLRSHWRREPWMVQPFCSDFPLRNESTRGIHILFLTFAPGSSTFEPSFRANHCGKILRFTLFNKIQDIYEKRTHTKKSAHHATMAEIFRNFFWFAFSLICIQIQVFCSICSVYSGEPIVHYARHYLPFSKLCRRFIESTIKFLAPLYRTIHISPWFRFKLGFSMRTTGHDGTRTNFSHFSRQLNYRRSSLFTFQFGLSLKVDHYFATRGAAFEELTL